MNSCMFSIVVLVSIGPFLSLVYGGCIGNIPTCEWAPWNGWSDCNRECAGGTKRRDRKFCCKAEFLDNIELCMKDCGMDRSGFYDRKDCNAFCFNGGENTFPGYCHCSDRYRGTCCRNGEFKFIGYITILKDVNHLYNWVFILAENTSFIYSSLLKILLAEANLFFCLSFF